MSATRILWGQILVVFALTLAGVWVGSYARGTWVDEPHTAKGYQSDYDLLVIVNDKRLVDRVKYWSKLDDRLMREHVLCQVASALGVHAPRKIGDQSSPFLAVEGIECAAAADRSAYFCSAVCGTHGLGGLVPNFGDNLSHASNLEATAT